MIDCPENDWRMEQTIFGAPTEVARAESIRRGREYGLKYYLPIPYAAFWIDTERLNFSQFNIAFESEMQILIAMTRSQVLTPDELAILRLGPGVCGTESAPSGYMRHRDFEYAKLFSEDLIALKRVGYETKKLTGDQCRKIDSLLLQVRPRAGLKQKTLTKLADLAEELNAEKMKNGFLRQMLAVKN